MKKGLIIIMMLLGITTLAGCGSGEKGKELEEKVIKYEKENIEYQEKIEKLEAEIKKLKSDNKEKKEEVKEKPIEEKKITYNTYKNERFGFSLKYPSFFTKGQDPENGDGVKFTAEGGKVELIASAGYNVLMDTVDSLYNETVKGKNVAYKNKGKDFFVVSFEKGENIVYEYRKVLESTISGFVITYPKELKDKYSKVVDEIYNSFSPAK